MKNRSNRSKEAKGVVSTDRPVFNKSKIKKNLQKRHNQKPENSLKIDGSSATGIDARDGDKNEENKKTKMREK